MHRIYQSEVIDMQITAWEEAQAKTKKGKKSKKPGYKQVEMIRWMCTLPGPFYKKTATNSISVVVKVTRYHIFTYRCQLVAM